MKEGTIMYASKFAREGRCPRHPSLASSHHAIKFGAPECSNDYRAVLDSEVLRGSHFAGGFRARRVPASILGHLIPVVRLILVQVLFKNLDL